MITNHIFFLEILNAVCLSVDLVPNLIQIFFLPKLEQKLVQRCETEIVANVKMTYESVTGLLCVCCKVHGRRK